MRQWRVYNHTGDCIYVCYAKTEDLACRQAIIAGCLDVAGAI